MDSTGKAADPTTERTESTQDTRNTETAAKAEADQTAQAPETTKAGKTAQAPEPTMAANGAASVRGTADVTGAAGSESAGGGRRGGRAKGPDRRARARLRLPIRRGLRRSSAGAQSPAGAVPAEPPTAPAAPVGPAAAPAPAGPARTRTAPVCGPAPGAPRGFPSARAAGRIDALDGLRALAVALVVVYHVDHDLVPGGAVAVDVFFALSGFVITRLLLAEFGRSGRIALLPFYRRRWLRLVPALLVLCAVCLLLSVTTSLWAFEGAWPQAALAAGFVTNVERALTPGPYGGGPLAHTWSLGVEEQFYLLWPPLLLLLLRRSRARTVLVCTAVLCALPLLWRWLLWAPEAAHRIYNGADTRADQLLAGALAALVLARLRADDARLARLRTWTGRLAPVALLLLGLVAWRVPVTGDLGAWAGVWYTAGYLAVAVASVTLLTGLVLRPEILPARLLSLGPLAWVGRNLSYGIYLWHYPVVRLLAELGLDSGLLSATALLTPLLALASYHAVEAPFLRRSRRRRERGGKGHGRARGPVPGGVAGGTRAPGAGLPGRGPTEGVAVSGSGARRASAGSAAPPT